MIAVAFVCQGVAMAQGVPPVTPLPIIPNLPPQATPLSEAPRQLPRPGSAGPPAAAGFQGQVNQDAVNAMVDRRLKEIEEAKKQEEEQKKQFADQQGYVVGSNLPVTANFKDGLFLWLDTPNKDFTMHLGGWMQLDNVFWDQSPALKTSYRVHSAGTDQGVASGDNLGGIGDLQDGVYFRRIRPFAEGTFWETGEYRLIIALENDQYDTTGLDEFWVGETKIPVIGTIRAGHVKDPVGLEGDMTASSRCMTFMERSSYSQAIELDQNFVTGLWLSNNYFDQRATWSFSVFRPDVAAATGYAFGDDQWGWQGRLTALPIYEDDGRRLLHLGLSGGWRSGTTNPGTASLNTVTLACRPEMRDDDPAKAGHQRRQQQHAEHRRHRVQQRLPDGPGSLVYPRALLAPGRVWLELRRGRRGHRFNATRRPEAYAASELRVQRRIRPSGVHADRREPRLRQARRHAGQGVLRQGGPTSKFFIVRDENGNIISSWGAGKLPLAYSYVNLNDGSGA